MTNFCAFVADSMEEEIEPSLFIGLDFSTQQIKAVVIDEQLSVTAEACVHLDSMLPEYRTTGGVCISGLLQVWV